jgi:hypothetical protein
VEREDLVQIVDRIHATWNQPIPKGPDQKTIYNAWWILLQHQDADAVHRTVTELAVQETFMPKPGQILRKTVLREKGFDPPSSAEAWMQFRQMAQAAMSGTYTTTGQIHPIVARVVNTLGGTNSYHLNTNGDREIFLTQYEKEITTTENQLLHTPTPKH